MRNAAFACQRGYCVGASPQSFNERFPPARFSVVYSSSTLAAVFISASSKVLHHYRYPRMISSPPVFGVFLAASLLLLSSSPAAAQDDTTLKILREVMGKTRTVDASTIPGARWTLTRSSAPDYPYNRRCATTPEGAGGTAARSVAVTGVHGSRPFFLIFSVAYDGMVAVTQATVDVSVSGTWTCQADSSSDAAAITSTVGAPGDAPGVICGGASGNTHTYLTFTIAARTVAEAATKNEVDNFVVACYHL